MNIAMKKWDIVVVGELNIDIILNGIKSFPEMGKEILANDFSFVLGSTSATFASNIAALGAKVAFCGSIGQYYFGDFILSKLKERAIDTSMVTRLKENHTGVTFIFSFANNRASVTYPGTIALSSIKMIGCL